MYVEITKQCSLVQIYELIVLPLSMQQIYIYLKFVKALNFQLSAIFMLRACVIHFSYKLNELCLLATVVVDSWKKQAAILKRLK